MENIILSWYYKFIKLRGSVFVREFAKAFYQSKAWRETRAYIFRRDMGLCTRCGKPGEIVHHKKYLTPENIDNPAVTLNESNLELLCRECHAIEHEGVPPIAQGLKFDEKGNLVKIGGEGEYE